MSETPGQKKFIEYIEHKPKTINYSSFEEYFNVATTTFLKKQLFKIKNKNKNNEFVKLTKVRWSNLKDKIKKMSKEEIEIEKADKILKIVEEILNFNYKMQKESGGKSLEILTPNQMLSRLPITLAKLKAGNNSEKLKNEIR